MERTPLTSCSPVNLFSIDGTERFNFTAVEGKTDDGMIHAGFIYALAREHPVKRHVLSFRPVSGSQFLSLGMFFYCSYTLDCVNNGIT